MSRCLLIVIGMAVVVVCLYALFATTRELYGPVKNIKQIPFNRCADICEGYYQQCIKDFRYAGDPGWCENQFRKACVMECYYSRYHRP